MYDFGYCNMASVVINLNARIDRVEVFRTSTGRPTMLAYRTMIVGSDDEEGRMAAFIREDIVREARILQIDPLSLIGYLTIENAENGLTTNVGRYVNYTQITRGKIEGLMIRVGESNNVPDFEDLIFRFHILVNPVAGGKVAKPKWWPKLCLPILWETPDDLNCMIFSLVYLMWNTKKNFKARPKRAEKISKEIMEKLEWQKIEPVSKLENVVKLDDFKKCKIVLIDGITNLNKPVQEHYIWTGEDYQLDLYKGTPSDKNLLYLYYDMEKQHVAGIKKMKAFIDRKHPMNFWCHKCLYAIQANRRHNCDESDSRRDLKTRTKTCKYCNEIVHDDKKIDKHLHHNCPFQCKSCKGLCSKGTSHRCILWADEPDEKKNNWETSESETGKYKSLWAYDFECKIVKKRLPIAMLSIEKFYRDEEGYFVPGDNNYVESYSWEIDEHEVNFVYCKNVFTGEERYFGENDGSLDHGGVLQRFINFACSYNDGNNTFAAHNARGYDSRLLLHHMYDCKDKNYVDTLMSGQKLLQLKIGPKNSSRKTIFIDTMSHLPGSLKKLAKDMCGNLLAKGYFPHQFNTVENYGYNGPLPGKEQFDIYFSAKSQKDVDEFDSWWEERNGQGDWNFMKEMKFYNQNDVLVLADIMKKYHDIMMTDSGLSPWFSVTGPAYCHKVTLIENLRLLHEEHGLDDLKKNYPNSYVDKIVEIATNKYWAIKRPVEYAPVKKAFRGGRTEIVALYSKLSQQEMDDGVQIRAADICSSYPAQQIKQMFPVGLPRIKIWDLDYRPCCNETCIHSLERVKCQHEMMRYNPDDRSSTVVTDSRIRKPNDHPYTLVEVQPLASEILDQDWNGYVCVTIQPCKMLHPIIPYFDDVLNKCIFSCEKLVEVWVDSPTLKTALKNGYVLEKVHAFHEYNMRDSLWADTTMRRFIAKTINSGEEPENLEELAQKYEDNFSEEFGDRLRATKGKWGNNPALRAVNKTAANCGWGKHAQKVIQTQTEVIHDELDSTRLNHIVQNSAELKYDITSINTLHDCTRLFKYTKKDSGVRPDLSNIALDAAAFVPAYGRLQLWNQLDRLEKDNPGVLPRVVNMDTDSIYYKWYPESFGVYNIPETEILGGWTRDDDSRKGGIMEFVGLGPKTYAYKCVDGSVSDPKTKGVRLGYSTGKIVNFETFKQNALAQLNLCSVNERLEREGRKLKKARHLIVPQTNFDSKNGRVVTSRSLKKLGVDIEGMKRTLKSDGYMYPYGFDDAPQRVEKVWRSELKF